MPPAPRRRPVRPVRRRPDRYHHGDLRRALLLEAVRTIHAEGAAALTLRDVGDRLGVSRTALYRHFADKQALLDEVAAEGFRMLRTALHEAWGRGGRAGFDAMGVAYVHFARGASVALPRDVRRPRGEARGPPPIPTAPTRAPTRSRCWSTRSSRSRPPAASAARIRRRSRSTSGRWCTASRCSRSTGCCRRRRRPTPWRGWPSPGCTAASTR